MIKKRFFLIFSCLFLISAFFFGIEPEKIQIIGNLDYSPLSIGNISPLDCITASTSWLLGRQKQQPLRGIEFSGTFFFLNSQPDSEIPASNQFTISILQSNLYQINSSLQMKWSWGGGWTRDTINTLSGRQIDDYAGITFLNNLQLYFPWEYLWLEFINILDLNGSLDTAFKFNGFALSYCGGIRLNFKPGLNWLNIYLEAKGIYRNYSQAAIHSEKWMIQFGAGASIKAGFNLPEKQVPQPMDIPVLESDSTEDIQTDLPPTVEVISDEPPEDHEPGLKLLETCGKGDKIGFYNILFEINSDSLTEDSFILLDKIAAILKEKQGLVIAISAYAIYTEDPENDIKLYTLRTRKIKQYLTTKGIEPGRLQINPVGYLLINTRQTKPRMFFEILAL